MRHEIPQFIDVKDKIIGPLTFTQFMYVGGGAGLAYLCIKLLGTFFGFIVAAPIGALTIALAFFPYNGRPFIHTVEAWAQHMSREKTYLWKRRTVPPKLSGVEEIQKRQSTAETTPQKPRIDDLSWSLDIFDQNNQ